MSITDDEITELCERAIANYKKPQSVGFVQQLPEITTGKMLKILIKARV